jgi:septation ring formation regulator EzrA
MAQIITNSSIAINSLTSDISASLNKIHEDIDQNYAVVSRILSAVNQVLKHLDALQLFLVA